MDRQELRQSLLKEAYDWNFANNGRYKSVIQEVSQDQEKHLAYEYLHQKGLIDYKVSVAGLERRLILAEIKITARGIDVVENDKSVDKI